VYTMSNENGDVSMTSAVGLPSGDSRPIRQLVHWPLMGGLLNLKRGRGGRVRDTVLRS